MPIKMKIIMHTMVIMGTMVSITVNIMLMSLLKLLMDVLPVKEVKKLM